MIIFKNLNAKYNEKNIVLKNINLTINEGEKVFLIGKSGSGKTTLFNCLTNREIISKGKLFFNNKDINDLSKKQYKKKLQSFAQISQINTCIEDINVFKNIYKDMKQISIFNKLLGISSKKTTAKILNTLEKLEIFEKAFNKFSDLSGGQKQRVEIAKEIINDHTLIIADEPTTSLDIVVAKKIIKNLIENNNKTTLISVHNLDLIPPKSRVIAIKNGKLIFDDSKNNLRKKDVDFIYEK